MHPNVVRRRWSRRLAIASCALVLLFLAAAVSVRMDMQPNVLITNLSSELTRSAPDQPSSTEALPRSAAPASATPSDFRRAIDFAGYGWRVRSANEPEGPGPNYFSDAPDHVWVDGNGWLHLRVAPSVDGRWYGAEIESAASPGYGTYEFEIGSRINELDPNVTIGLFTWSDDPAENHRELDIEFAAFGQSTQQTGRYTRQPYTDPANVYLFEAPATDDSAHRFEWRPSEVTFQSWTGAVDATNPAARVVARHTFMGGAPSPGGEHVHMNVWLDAGRPPTDGQPIEVVVRSFTFKPPQ